MPSHFSPLDNNNREEYFICPFDDTHQIRAIKWVFHIDKCQKNFPNVKVKRCHFNSRHIVREENFERHLTECPDKNVIYSDMFSSIPKLSGDLNFPHPCPNPVAFETPDVEQRPATVYRMRGLYGDGDSMNSRSITRDTPIEELLKRKQEIEHERVAVGKPILPRSSSPDIDEYQVICRRLERVKDRKMVAQQTSHNFNQQLQCNRPTGRARGRGKLLNRVRNVPPVQSADQVPGVSNYTGSSVGSIASSHPPSSVQPPSASSFGSGYASSSVSTPTSHTASSMHTSNSSTFGFSYAKLLANAEPRASVEQNISEYSSNDESDDDESLVMGRGRGILIR